MCGIVGVVSKNSVSVVDNLLTPLQRLEYRGYDSCGFATSEGVMNKDVGKISEFMKCTRDRDFKAGICHTRWATHGGKTRANAHPHHNEEQTIFAVHNGIIENYQEIRSKLEAKGYKFLSDTDTEIIPHLFDYFIRERGYTASWAIKEFFKEVEGTYAVLLMIKDQDDHIYAFKKDSPLVLGICDDRNIVASDIHSFTDRTTEAIFFNDMEYAIISSDRYSFHNVEGDEIKKDITFVEGNNESSMEKYPHYMLKEINDQPSVSARLIQSLNTDQSDDVSSLADLIKNTKRTVFVACGTSYHASLIGGAVLSKMGYDIHNVIASEFDTFYKVDENTLIVAISQSGETMDVVTVIKKAKAKGATVASLVNVPYSTITRESEVSVNILAGQEISVASTKAFTNQVIALLKVANDLGNDINISDIPNNIANTIRINEAMAKVLARDIGKHNHVFFLGRGLSYPVAREMALKLKEISYIHAEGMMAGELKHGSIALIDPKAHTPVINLIPNGDSHMKSCSQEVAARGARVITVTNTAQGDFTLPDSNEVGFAIYSVVVGQLLSYYTAVERKCDVDQPRNLAKSVTVH